MKKILLVLLACLVVLILTAPVYACTFCTDGGGGVSASVIADTSTDDLTVAVDQGHNKMNYNYSMTCAVSAVEPAVTLTVMQVNRLISCLKSRDAIAAKGGYSFGGSTTVLII